MPADTRHDSKEIDHVWKLIEDVRICMLATVNGESVRARPMSAIARQSENAIYFLTDISGHKDDEIDAHHDVCLAFQQTSSGKYLSLTGAARVLDDRALIKDLWSIAAEAWWEGPDDPSVRVLEVTPRDAQYWESASAPVAWVQMTLAAAFGAKPNLGERREVDLN